MIVDTWFLRDKSITPKNAREKNIPIQLVKITCARILKDQVVAATLRLICNCIFGALTEKNF